MARRQRGTPVHGWLVLDKPAGPSSAQAVARARRALDARKAGHAGTLDPAATGLLAIAFGEATKTVPHVTEAQKRYHFTVRWGAETATDDAAGAVTRTSGTRPGEAEIRAALQAFTGDILQVPPQVSAVKVDGQRAYDLARSGQSLDLEARPLHVARLELMEIPDSHTAVFEMDCGKGGYVRAIARDLGRALGSLGHVVDLRRLRTGPFDVRDAVDWQDLEPDNADALRTALLPLETGLGAMAEVSCSPESAARLRHGNAAQVTPTGHLDFGTEAWVSHAGEPVAIGHFRGGLLHPSRVFVLD